MPTFAEGARGPNICKYHQKFKRFPLSHVCCYEIVHKNVVSREKDNENENPENLLKEVCDEFSKIQDES